MRTTMLLALATLLGPAVTAASAQPKPKRSWPMFGGTPGRNMVNTVERNIPIDWCIEKGKRKNIKWVAELGSHTYGSPAVAGGKVYVATNNDKPRDPKLKGHKAVLMAFRETDGAFLWQIAHDVPFAGHWHRECPSPPTVDRGKLYYFTPGCEVVCADADKGEVHWRYSTIKELKVQPGRWHCFAPPLASPLVIGDLVFSVTGNGPDWKGKLVAKAPSFVALNKRTGKLVWQSNLPGRNIIEGQWSSGPAFADHGGRRQIIFGGGDGVIYSFAPKTGKLLWKCDCLPTRKKKNGSQTDNYFAGTPVVVGDRLYVGMGVEPFLAPRVPWSYFLCLDITKKGDVSLKSYDAKAAVNKGSALVWAFGGPVKPRPKDARRVFFGSTMSTAAVHDGLVYIPEHNGYMYCLDAKTGKHYWTHDFLSGILGSPLWVDGKVYVANDDSDVVIFAHGRNKKVLAKMHMDANEIHTTPVAVSRTLYIATDSKLYAISAR